MRRSLVGILARASLGLALEEGLDALVDVDGVLR